MASTASAVRFPRLHRRGPIEARCAWRLHWSQPTFPRLHRRGPIEAWRPRSGWRPSSRFPRLHRRGPIEAGWCPGERRRPRADFRAFTGAVPLKPPFCSTSSDGPDFRAFTGAVPLKQLGVALGFLRPGFPRLHRRGPIEARIAGARSGQGYLFPRLHRRGLIEAAWHR